jgi:hypothetical protein
MEPTFWEIVLDHWTVTIFLPAVLLLIAALAITTRIMDLADQRRRSDGRGRRPSGR